jgi:hypothetical protein
MLQKDNFKPNQELDAVILKAFNKAYLNRNLDEKEHENYLIQFLDALEFFFTENQYNQIKKNNLEYYTIIKDVLDPTFENNKMVHSKRSLYARNIVSLASLSNIEDGTSFTLHFNKFSFITILKEGDKYYISSIENEYKNIDLQNFLLYDEVMDKFAKHINDFSIDNIFTYFTYIYNNVMYDNILNENNVKSLKDSFSIFVFNYNKKSNSLKKIELPLYMKDDTIFIDINYEFKFEESFSFFQEIKGVDWIDE